VFKQSDNKVYTKREIMMFLSTDWLEKLFNWFKQK